jgi:uncharacterized tellurite resistance protein B-like protein
MLEHIHNLKPHEKDLIIHSPLYVSILIAGADGEIHETERQRTIQLIHTKTFSEKYDLKELYQTLDHDADEELRKIIAELPTERDARIAAVSAKLETLNHIMPKLEHHFQVHLYNSLRNFAHHISRAEDGFWGIGAKTHLEKDLVKLPMINNPSGEHE